MSAPRISEPDAFAALYPPEAWRVGVVEALAVKGFAPEFTPSAPAHDDGVPTYGKRLLARAVPVDGTGSERIGFVDKLFPHAPYDMMMVALGDAAPCSFADLSAVERLTILEMVGAFLEHVGRPDVIERYGLHGGRFHTCWNFDRRTRDRENSMFFEKRFHLHLNYWPGADTELRPRPLGELADLGWRRRLVDPIAHLAPQVLYDATGGGLDDVRFLVPDARRDLEERLPPGLKVRIDGWSELGETWVAHFIARLHNASQEVYDTLLDAFTEPGAPSGTWERPALRPADEVEKRLAGLEWLSPASRAGLKLLAHRLRDLPPRVMRAFRDGGGQFAASTLSGGASSWRSTARMRHLALADLDYNLGFFSPRTNEIGAPLATDSPVHLVVNYKLFADIGGAGLPPMGTVPIVRIVRGSSPLDTEEMAMRSAFHRELLDAGTARLATPRGSRAAWILEGRS